MKIHKVFISRSGYTGEDGFEISILNNIAENFVQKLFKMKIQFYVV